MYPLTIQEVHLYHPLQAVCCKDLIWAKHQVLSTSQLCSSLSSSVIAGWQLERFQPQSQTSWGTDKEWSPSRTPCFISHWPELVSYPLPSQPPVRGWCHSQANQSPPNQSPHGWLGGGGAASFPWVTWLHGVRGEAWTKHIWLRKNQGNRCWVGKMRFLPPEFLAHGEEFIVSPAYSVLHAYHGLCIFLK